MISEGYAHKGEGDMGKNIHYVNTIQTNWKR